MYSVGIITASDKGSVGEREDVSGALIKELVIAAGYRVVSHVILPDDIHALSNEMIRLADELQVELILTTGGTGFSQRDVTPEATKIVIEREVPGIPEAMRAYSLQLTPKAMLSRAIAGIRKRSLIVNLPGSPKAVRETLNYILPPIHHGIQILVGDVGECGQIKFTE